MDHNNSPWLYQLKRTRPVNVLREDVKGDIVIVGAGISGVVTAYFILKNTDRNVTLIEGNKVAHGATGHNAGQLVAEFEREFVDLVREYGLEKTAEAEKSVRSAWLLLEEICVDANLTTPLSTFIGYNGYKSIDHLLEEIKANALRAEADIQNYPIYIAEEALKEGTIPNDFKHLYEIVPQENILSLLETKDTSYVAAIAARKGCTNSALFSEELVGYMLSKHPGRFSLFEHTSVVKINLQKDIAVMDMITNMKDGNPEEEHQICCNKVILCTNGFERLKIENQTGDDIDTKFHHMVNGDVSYMSAYVEEMKNPPTALGYYDQETEKMSDAYATSSYYYMTRRPYEIEENQSHNLICIGGPEVLIEETQKYERDQAFDKVMGEDLDNFVKRTLSKEDQKELEYKFQWHGLMCYTPSKMRVIGAEPKNENLLYNLGCNGVGILPSIYGGYKLSKQLVGETFPESIFDPKK